MLDFAGFAAEDQREVGASEEPVPAGGAVGQGRQRDFMLQCSVALQSFAAHALRVASLLHAPRAAMIAPASDEGNPGKGGKESADTGADQREGLCAPAHKLLALTATS
jgi:hypothetical protein